ncbi:OmpH family outer membrane protein [Salinimicrobium sp. GXAS 041]|uniref:OmpH family outer membrane protein n=1 Tax=Salinimicrobium sp. GXAS 041 TaxID=3400806 RepID=UPI003C71B5EC
MKKLLSIVLLGTALIGCNEQKTAYVDTTTLIQEYSEMKEVEAEFTTRSDEMKRQFDSVARGFQQEVQAYQQEMDNMSQTQRQETESRLMQTQQRLQQQQQQMGGALREESDAVIDSIVTKVKDYVKEYGEENDYTYIFGSNESANIMYAEEGLDITDEILEKLNSEYEGN